MFPELHVAEQRLRIAKPEQDLTQNLDEGKLRFSGYFTQADQDGRCRLGILGRRLHDPPRPLADTKVCQSLELRLTYARTRPPDPPSTLECSGYLLSVIRHLMTKLLGTYSPKSDI